MGFHDARKGRGLYSAEVIRTKRVTPNMVRVTVGGPDMKNLPHHGFDHWFRLFLPRLDGTTDFTRIPTHMGTGVYMKYLAQTKSGTRPVMRNYTVRDHRPEVGEIDIDFVAHGDQGVAGLWAQQARVGEKVALIDQGCGFDLPDVCDFYLLAGDESALPAILGILRDLPEDSVGLALIEVPETGDIQEVHGPDGIQVRWLPRDDHSVPIGSLALNQLLEFTPNSSSMLYAYVVGERKLATEGRRHMVRTGVPKAQISFVGYWRAD